MIICDFCGYENREGEFFCEECGNPILEYVFAQEAETEALSTRQLGSQPADFVAFDKPIWGTAHFKRDSVIVIHVDGAPEPMVVQPKADLLVGRHDVQANHFPDIDLTPYGAVEEGVSRVHARLQYNEDTLTLADLDSVNGTYLNGQRLISNQPRVLHDGDEVRFGKLVAHIYFK